MKRTRHVGILVAGGTAAAIAAAVCLMIVISITYDSPPGEEQPKVTDWMQAWGSIFAVAAGVAAALFSAGLLLHEMRQATEARADASRERAEAAADRARIEEDRAAAIKLPALAVFAGNVAVRGQESRGLVNGVSVEVDNYGMGPVRQLAVTVSSASDSVTLPSIRVIAPGGHEMATRSYSPPLKAANIASGAGLRVSVVFIDMYGRTWARVNNGEPVPADRVHKG